MTTDIQRAIESDSFTSVDRLKNYTRSASFSMQLGIREIRLLQAQPWNTSWGMQSVELAALHKLIDKGLLEHKVGETPRLTEAGKLMRQLLALSEHITPKDVCVDEHDVFGKIERALAQHAEPLYTHQKGELREINGELNLVVQLNGGDGWTEWAIPRSAVQRIG